MGLLQELGHFLLHAVGLRQGGDAGLRENFVLGHVRRCGGIVSCLDRILRRNHVFLLSAHDLANGVERIDLPSHVAVQSRRGADGQVDRGQRNLRVGLVGQVRIAEIGAFAV